MPRTPKQQKPPSVTVQAVGAKLRAAGYSAQQTRFLSGFTVQMIRATDGGGVAVGVHGRNGYVDDRGGEDLGQKRAAVVQTLRDAGYRVEERSSPWVHIRVLPHDQDEQ